MKAVVRTDQQQESISLELSCNSDLVRSYDVLKAVPMGHKDKFYQRILSEQRQTLVDISQSLPNSLHGDEVNGNDSPVEEFEGDMEFQQGDNGQDGWFNTWPERCEKDVKTSPRSCNNHLSNNTRQIASKSRDNSIVALCNGGKVSLNEALQNISLAYSPVTKKLHLITRNTDQNEHEQLLANCRDNPTTHDNTRHIHEQSSDIMTTTTLLDNDTDTISDCTFTKTTKKTGIIQFFNKNVFPPWKSIGSSTTLSVWSLFNNKTSAESSVNSDSPKHEAIIASSSALIQLKRPSNLPAKTVEEEQKHRGEYEAMIAAVKRKDALNSVARLKQQKHQLLLEEQQAAATKHFLNTVLPNWEAARNLRKTRDIWWQGLPSSVRGRVWRKAIGNDLNITPQLYEICLARAQNLLHSDFTKHTSSNEIANNLDIRDSKNKRESFLNKTTAIKQNTRDLSGKSDIYNSFDGGSLMCRRASLCADVLSVDQQLQANLAAVQLDIARVFPNLCIFQEGGPYSDVLHSLLAAYVCYRPDVGYVQGMAYLAAILTLNLQPTYAFISFANVLNGPLHVAAYTLDEGALTARYRTFERCLGAQLPRLCAHMATANLTPDLYLLDWVYTVYAKAMPLDVASRVWDVWLRDGQEEFVFRTALGILHLYQDQLLTMDFLHGSQFLTRLPEDLSSEQLFRSIRLVSTTVGKQTFAQIVQSFTQSEYSNS